MTSRTGERASAMVAAISIMVIGGFIIVAVMVNGMSSSSNSRATENRAAAEQLAREAGATLATIYSTMESGEFDNFVPLPAVLQKHANSVGGTVSANPTSIGAVDPSVAGRSRSVCRALGDGRRGCWQLFAVKPPQWGTTKAGAVTVYVRAWTQSSGRLSDPLMFRLDVRPTWLSDYQLVADGKIAFGAAATINGRVHSNGRSASFFNQYNHPALTAQITVGFGGPAFCTGNARLSTTQGPINTSASPSCANNKFEDTRREVNLLRAQAMARQLRYVYSNLPRPNIAMASFNNTSQPVDVRLNGNTVIANGQTLTAATSPTHNGAVVLATGDVRVRGTLNPTARALIVAMSSGTGTSLTNGSAASVTVTNTGAFGAANATGSSLGIVAQGDIIVPHPGGGCNLTMRGAFTAMSGMLSIDRKLRVPFLVDASGGSLCNTARIEGSIAGHYPSLLFQGVNNAGFQNRTYTYHQGLFDNPPPMYLTAFDWQVHKFAPADLNCFNASGDLDMNPGSGCVA